jgi:hypothetical protein
MYGGSNVSRLRFKSQELEIGRIAMVKRSKLRKQELGWPHETIALAHAARRHLFDALHSLRPANVECKDKDRYERLFAQAESVLDHTEAYKLLAAAQEYLFRTREPFDAPHASEEVARTYAHQLLIALFYYWNAEVS